jgi:hypothetical protein
MSRVRAQAAALGAWVSDARPCPPPPQGNQLRDLVARSLEAYMGLFRALAAVPLQRLDLAGGVARWHLAPLLEVTLGHAYEDGEVLLVANPGFGQCAEVRRGRGLRPCPRLAASQGQLGQLWPFDGRCADWARCPVLVAAARLRSGALGAAPGGSADTPASCSTSSAPA